MKKKPIIVLTLGLVCALVSCQKQPTAEIISTPAPSVSVTPAPTPSPSPTPTPTPTEWPTAEDIFPRFFYFMSGAGGWCTELNVAADGSFSGYYHASAYGGEDGNEWTVYFCDFTGKFSAPEKVNEYTYSVMLEELVKEPAEKTITEDGVFIPNDIAFGIEGGEEFFIYLPGAPLDELPEEFVLWVKAPMIVTDEDTTLPYYGLYNVEEQTGFFGYAD